MTTPMAYALQAGAQPDIKEQPTGRTPLHCAVRSRNFAAMQKLLVAGASYEVKDKEGYTALDVIVESLKVRFCWAGLVLRGFAAPKERRPSTDP